HRHGRSLQRRRSEFSAAGLDPSRRNRRAFVSSLERLFHHCVAAARARPNGNGKTFVGQNNRRVLSAPISANCAGIFRVRSGGALTQSRRDSPELAVGFYRHGELVHRLAKSVAAHNCTSLVDLCAGTVLSSLAAADPVSTAK